MNDKIDVLKLMDEVTEVLLDVSMVTTARDLEEARAAVASIIAAMEGLDEAYCRAGPQLTRYERMEDRKRLIAARAALARVKGE